MITIGIRATPSAVTFAVYDSDADKVVNVEEIVIPAAFGRPDGLKHLRSNLLDVLREFKVEKAAIRVTESIAQNASVERIENEGVIQEAFASSELKDYYVARVANISARLGFDRTKFKLIVDGENALNIENWKKMSKEEREAILCAKGAVNA